MLTFEYFHSIYTPNVSDGAISMLDLPEHIHDALAGLEGSSFMELTLSESRTNHNHEDIVENIEVYEYTAIRHIRR